jgi:porphobilinogen synthase
LTHTSSDQVSPQLIRPDYTRPMLSRPRRNRATGKIRDLVRETSLTAEHLVLPLFVHEGQNSELPIASMPGQARLSIDRLVARARQAFDLSIPAVALFPAIAEQLKDPHGRESANPDGLLARAVRALKTALPELVVITDVALDPYSSDGHDGVVIDGRIDNDQTLPILAKMAVTQARAGADIVAPSDMMDGRVGAIRKALDEAGHAQVCICSYCVKYASAFYGPFREALDSAPKAGDKKTYQMDPANLRECLREIELDETEGADWLMVKPALPYADVIRYVREHSTLPVAAYHVSGEYAMLRAAAQNGWLDYERCLIESLLCLRRAGADIIFTYGAIDAARVLADPQKR